MTTTTQTMPASQIRPSAYPTEHAPYNDPTIPPFSKTRTNGIVWTEALLAGARVSSGDAARFLKGPEG
jgi:hypothetical protein